MIGFGIEVEELIYVGCGMGFEDIVDGCTVLYVGTCEVFVKGLLCGVWKLGLVVVLNWRRLCKLKFRSL